MRFPLRETIPDAAALLSVSKKNRDGSPLKTWSLLARRGPKRASKKGGRGGGEKENNGKGVEVGGVNNIRENYSKKGKKKNRNRSREDGIGERGGLNKT